MWISTSFVNDLSRLKILQFERCIVGFDQDMLQAGAVEGSIVTIVIVINSIQPGRFREPFPFAGKWLENENLLVARKNCKMLVIEPPDQPLPIDDPISHG